MRERVAALHQEFQRVVEAGGVGLALIGNRPQPADIVAEQRRGHRGLPRRHPVVVAAQRIDLAVMRDVAVRMRQRPGRERIGREALVHQRERALEIRVVQIGIVGAELVGQEHALVDHRAAGDRHRVIAAGAALAAPIEHGRDCLAQDVEPALEFVVGRNIFAARDEKLNVPGLGRRDRDAERRVIGRNVARAEDTHAFARDLLGVDVEDFFAPRVFMGQEKLRHSVLARLRQFEAEFLRLPDEELVRDLHQNAGAVAHARVGADRAAMLQIAEDAQAVFDDQVRLAALDVGNESDAAGILVERRIVQALRQRRAGIGGGAGKWRSVAGAHCGLAFAKSCAALSRAHLILPRRRHHGLRRTRLVRRAVAPRSTRNRSREGQPCPVVAAVAAPVGCHRCLPAAEGRHGGHRY